MTGFSKKVRGLVHVRAHGVCEKCGLASHNLQYHHRRPRSMGGSRRKDTNQAANCVLVCLGCHSDIESYRRMSLDTGWLVRQYNKPADVPLWRHSQWVLLDDHGCVLPTKETA